MPLGGLGLKNVTETAIEDYDNSCQIKLHLKNMILDTQEEGDKTKSAIMCERRQKQEARLESIREDMTNAEKRLIDTNLESGVQADDITPEIVGL